MSGNHPTVWCLLGKKAGDNTQVVALAGALGWEYECKHIIARPWELLTHLGLGVTLAGIDQRASSVLEPPWPDLILTAGRRNEPVARWIARQSGGCSRLVHIGRPWSPLATWDLIVTTPQYSLPEQPNVLYNSLPLHALSSEALDTAARQWLPQVAPLPRPRIAVLIGGDSGRFVMTSQKGAQLGRLVNDLAAKIDGSLMITDSPRTPAEVGEAVRAEVQVRHFFHRVAAGGENPYMGLLALADAFVVTGESMSMLGEAAVVGRPLFIFDIGDGDTAWWRLRHNYRYKTLSDRLARWIAPQRMRRDITRIQRVLVADGRAAWLSPDELSHAANFIVDNMAGMEGLISDSANRPQIVASERSQAELQRSAARVKQLVIGS